MRKSTKLLKTLLLIIYDLIVVNASSILSVIIMGGNIADIICDKMYLSVVVINSATILAVFFAIRAYRTLPEYMSVFDAIKIMFGCVAVTLAHYVELLLLIRNHTWMPGYILIFMLLMSIFVFVLRFARRVRNALTAYISNARGTNGIPTMIVGAGDAGITLLREMENSDKLTFSVKCFVDDNISKIGTYVYGIRVAGNRDKIPELVKKHGIKEIYIAMPSCPEAVVNEITAICKQTGCRVKSLPGIYQFVNGETSFHSYKEISIEDLLARKTVKVDLDKIMAYVSGKVIMVTGGGGSIGSELCRQIAAHAPHRLIIVDIYENNAYDIQQELITKYPMLDLKVLIASVRDEKRMEKIFATYHPQIVYHAAAHKHVPLMEESPNEAIKNNVFGTYKTAKLADKYGVKKFVLISTDKAVNPTNVMGATKRICEMIVQSLDKISKTEFVAVRFGNVLGSNGSVIPLFKKQIAAGGPVLVTHPDIIRYFMTIPEAVALVIQAGAYAHGGEIFVLDMGKPVKILDLAENIIRLSGYIPYKDIDIKFTGLRPGEKLYEEMLMEEEGLQETENKLIHIGKPIEMDEDKFFEQLKELKRILSEEPSNARLLISKIVPTYNGNTDLENI